MSNLYQQFRTRTFNEIFPSDDESTGLAKFTAWYKNGMFPIDITDANLSIVYYSLIARYGNSHIANSDENQFKVNLLYILFKYGPTWQKELSIQSSLRTMTDAQIQEGAEAVYNTAMNPGDLTAQSGVIQDGKLTYINQQNVTKFKKAPLEGYSILLELLKKDVTNAFIEKFKDLFIKILYEYPLLYATEEEES